eukprot:scaffold13.g220.t1
MPAAVPGEKPAAWDPKNRDSALRANLPHSAGREISVYTAMAVPFVRHQGNPAIGITLHASYLLRSRGVERTYNFVAIRGPDTEVWIGAVLLVFTYTLPGKEHGCTPQSCLRALADHEAARRQERGNGLQRMRWEYASHPVLKRQVPRCDVVEAGSLLGWVLTLHDPPKDGCFFYQHLVLCESSAHQS